MGYFIAGIIHSCRLANNAKVLFYSA